MAFYSYSHDNALPPVFQQPAPAIDGQFYRNAMYTEDISSPKNLVSIFANDHYMMSSSYVMDHTYETIDDSDLIAQYNGEYHRYSKLESQDRTYSNSPASDDPSTYDKLSSAQVELPPANGFNANGREQQSRKEHPQPYSMLEIQTNTKGKAYNKLQRKKQEVIQPAKNKEDYDQIDLSDALPDGEDTDDTDYW